MGNIVAALRTPPAQTFIKVTFPEGYAVAQMAARLEETVPRLTAAKFSPRRRAARSRASSRQGVGSLEGLLFPDTYQIAGNETEAQIVARLVAADDPGRPTASGSTKLPEPGRSFAVRGAVVASMIERRPRSTRTGP